MNLEEARAIVAAEARRQAKRAASTQRVRCECCDKYVVPSKITLRVQTPTSRGGITGVKVCDECNAYYSDDMLRRMKYNITEYPAAWCTGSNTLVPNANSSVSAKEVYGSSTGDRKEYAKAYRERRKAELEAAKAALKE